MTQRRHEVLPRAPPRRQVSALLLELHVAGHLLHYEEGPALQRRAVALDLLMRGLLKR